MADGGVACQLAQHFLVEGGGDEAHAGADHEVVAVAGGDAGELLPTVLEGIEAEIGEARHVLAGSPHAEDATGFVHLVVGGEVIGCGLLDVLGHMFLADYGSVILRFAF